MKNIFKIFVAVLVTFTIFACSRTGDIATLNVTTPAALTVDKSNIVLEELSDATVANTYNFTPIVFNEPTQVSNSIEFGLKGKNFVGSGTLNVPQGANKLSATVKDLNTVLISIGAEPNTVANVEARVKTSVGDGTYYYSNVIPMTVKTYKANPDLVYPKIYVPGSYGAFTGYKDWGENAGGSPNLFSPLKNDKYYGYIYMDQSDRTKDLTFKFTYAEQGWANNKGDISTNPNSYATLKDSGENILAPKQGTTYYIKVDWKANTYTMAEAAMGIIGDATPQGWNSDVKLQFNTTTKKFETTIALQAGKAFKFRNNDSWSIKLQPTGSDVTLVNAKETPIFSSNEDTVEGDYGYMVSETGTYKVVVDLHNSAAYTITVTKQ